MKAVGSRSPVNLFVSPPKFSPDPPGKPQLDLLPERQVLAIVVEAGLERTVVEIDQQRYLAQGGENLRVGQELQLQVLQTQPRLELKVLSNHLQDQIRQTLPLLTRSFDWSQLVGQLQQRSMSGQADQQVYHQLLQILNPPTATPPELEEHMATVVLQLKQLAAPAETSLTPGASPFISPPPVQFPATSKLSEAITQLIKSLQNQTDLLPKQSGQKLPQHWYVETRNLLTVLKQGSNLSQIPPSQQQLLLTTLRGIQQHPGVSPQLAGEVKQYLIQLNRQIVRDISPVERPTEAVVSGDSSGVPDPKGEVDLTQLSASLKQLLNRNLPEAELKPTLPAELLGKLEGLLSRLQQLPGSAGKVSDIAPELAMLAHQLEQLVTRQPDSPQGRQLRLLSQLLGLSLEPELLQREGKAVSPSLKLDLLNLQKDLGAEVKEPLHRLELFQLCKAKLAEEQVQFLPLPFNQLEEGYLLAEKRSGNHQDSSGGEAPLQISLSLRLSALGNLRIDMLYERGNLHLRLAGEDRGKMDYLRGNSEELRGSVQAVKLQGISFSADAQLPVRQLQQRLLPDLPNMLDARI